MEEEMLTSLFVRFLFPVTGVDILAGDAERLASRATPSTCRNQPLSSAHFRNHQTRPLRR